MTVALIAVTNAATCHHVHVTREGGRTTLCGRDAGAWQVSILEDPDPPPGSHRLCRTCAAQLDRLGSRL